MKAHFLFGLAALGLVSGCVNVEFGSSEAREPTQDLTSQSPTLSPDYPELPSETDVPVDTDEPVETGDSGEPVDSGDSGMTDTSVPV